MTADERWVGQQIQCPACKNTFIVPTGTRVETTAPRPPVIGTPAPQVATTRTFDRMSPLAIISFCLALFTVPLNALSWIVHVPIGLLGCIPAVVCGHIALSQIRSNPKLKGRGFAITGLIIGYLAIVLSLVSLVFLRLHHRPDVYRRNFVTSPAAPVAPAEPPVATDPNTAEIPPEPVSGTLENQPFTLKNVEISHGVLTLRSAESPGTEVVIFLFLNSDNQLSGERRIVPGQTPEPHIHLHWKEGSAMRSAATTRGYALHLEFGDQKGDTVPGKIYLEMPQSYGTKLAGIFLAKVK